ncbi:3-oxoacyl-[acyl-carrier-protein] synthase-3 [Micromonospora nigra]|uniref:3-oxoacyl-[acyl-carrier-protein] synthase-3 n=1 Tax=Micromonospora nigra TaxID=145857 RepID=A0A1C6RD03_9ACTN|nr:ketoacyl-ACP synthase III [Micromonospora nigra]SCL15029.1 3-oxoacyl-[acyl-carrier-protein] synthase-3 [Micromonospora nigra]
MTGQGGVSAVVTGIGHYLPDQVMTTRDVVNRVNERSGRTVVSPRVIHMFSGVEERRYAPPGTTSSELAARAGQAAMAAAGVDPTDIDLLLFAAVTQDVIEPATANIVQERLGCWNAAVFDVKNACNSFVNALDVAAAKIKLGQCRRVLVTTGEVASIHVAWQIRETDEIGLKLPALTVGDAGGAFVVEAGPAPGVLPGVFRSDGREWRRSVILSGGTLKPHDGDHFTMDCDGSRLHELGVERVPAVVGEVLEGAGWTTDDVKLVVPHQTSVQTIEMLRVKLGFAPEQVMVTVDRLGNTGAASIPVALSLAVTEGRAGPGDKILLVGGAAGFGVSVIPLVLPG